MRCPECVEAGLRSKVYVGSSATTLMSVLTYYDEEGRLVVDDPNTTTTQYSCSNGHRWAEEE